MTVLKTFIKSALLVGLLATAATADQMTAAEKKQMDKDFYLRILEGKGCGWLTSQLPTCQIIRRCDGLNIPRYLCPAVQDIVDRINNKLYPFN